MVFDITHMPAGKGVFPGESCVFMGVSNSTAVWTNNEKLGKWPEGGEIDIIEGSGNRNFNQMTLHVLDSCPLDVTQSKGDPSFQYNNKAPDCSKGSGWCGVLAPTTVSNAYGAGFNAGGGGQYILVRRNDEIVIYFIPRVLNYYIEDEYGMDTFNGWLQSIGAVQARFKSSPSCNLSKQIYDQSIIINTAFCGGLGNVDFDGDMQACMDYHMHADESAYTEAYWSIKGIKVFRPVGPSDSEPVQPVTFRGQYEYDYIDKNPSPWDGVPGPSASKDSFPGPLWTPGTDRPDGFTYPYSNGWTLGGPAPNYAPRPDPIPASPPVPASPAQPKKKNKAEEAKKEPAMNIGLMNMAVVEPPVDPVAAAATPAVAPQASHPVDPLHAPAPSVPDASTPPMPIAAAPVPDASVPPMPIAAAPVPDASVPPMPAPAATGSDNSGAVYAK